MSNNLIAWMHDDITWCMEDNCPLINCYRNPKNMMDSGGIHSYAMFRETDECEIYRMEQASELERGNNK